MAVAKKQPEKAPEEKLTTFPWYAKILIGTLGTIAIVKFTPIMEILTMSFYVVMIPMFLLASLSLISAGTVEAATNGWHSTVTEINRRVSDKLKAAA